MTDLQLQISGMSCGHCVSAVKNALGQLEGVEVRNVEIGGASVAYDPSRSSPEAIARAIEEEGYQVGPPTPVQLGRAEPRA